MSGAAGKTVNKTSSKQFRARYENYRDRGFMTLDVTATSVALHAYEVAADRPGARLGYRTVYNR